MDDDLTIRFDVNKRIWRVVQVLRLSALLCQDGIIEIQRSYKSACGRCRYPKKSPAGKHALRSLYLRRAHRTVQCDTPLCGLITAGRSPHAYFSCCADALFDSRISTLYPQLLRYL